MPGIKKNKMTAAGWSAVSYDGRLYGPERMSATHCRVCHMLLVDVLAEAGEETHPACAGWPKGVPRSEGAQRAREVLRSAGHAGAK